MPCTPFSIRKKETIENTHIHNQKTEEKKRSNIDHRRLPIFDSSFYLWISLKKFYAPNNLWPCLHHLWIHCVMCMRRVCIVCFPIHNDTQKPFATVFATNILFEYKFQVYFRFVFNSFLCLSVLLLRYDLTPRHINSVAVTV